MVLSISGVLLTILIRDHMVACRLIVWVCYSGQVTAGNVGGFLMALANTYGLVIIIMLLGHGLVQVPRKLWETSFNERQLQRHYFVAPKVGNDAPEYYRQ